jgi:hypothetical protein
MINVFLNSVLVLPFFVYSFGQELLSCILDIVDVPEIAKESVIDEDDFRKILDWCDIWVLLLTTTGKSLRRKLNTNILFSS